MLLPKFCQMGTMQRREQSFDGLWRFLSRAEKRGCSRFLYPFFRVYMSTYGQIYLKNKMLSSAGWDSRRQTILDPSGLSER